MSNEALIIGILAAVGSGAVAALVSGLFSRPKSRAETNKLVAEAGQAIDERWKGWADELQKRLDKQEKDFAEKVGALEARVMAAERVARSANGKIGRLENRVAYEQRITRKVIGWALTLRDEVKRLGGHPETIPREVEDYINDMDERIEHDRRNYPRPDDDVGRGMRKAPEPGDG